MSIHTSIQWCDSSVNLVMGCDGCELWPSSASIAAAIVSGLREHGHKLDEEKCSRIKSLLNGRLPTEIYHARASIAATVAQWSGASSKRSRKQIEKLALQTIAAQFKCYAGVLHLWRGGNDSKPSKRAHPGYAQKFEEPKLFPGRMADAARWSDLCGKPRADKSWVGGMPRLIFISDMGDALSAGIAFGYLQQEIIDNVRSVEGRRHIWLWLTKRPLRMARFCDWLFSQGIEWPENLVAMTSITSSRTTSRIGQLLKVRSRFHALSVEPLWEQVSLDLEGIDWAIVGGESAIRPADAKPFDIEWARNLREQCREAGAAFFVKQLGSRPFEGGTPIKLKDRHGGDWSEWPEELRVREMPTGFENFADSPLGEARLIG